MDIVSNCRLQNATRFMSGQGEFSERAQISSLGRTCHVCIEKGLNAAQNCKLTNLSESTVDALLQEREFASFLSRGVLAMSKGNDRKELLDIRVFLSLKPFFKNLKFWICANTASLTCRKETMRGNCSRYASFLVLPYAYRHSAKILKSAV